MKLLLINPKFPESFWSFSWVLQNVTPQVKALNSPLGLATLAALSPQDWEISIVDENIEAIDWDAKADIVGVCGMGVQADRQKEIIRHFKNRGMYVVSGGSFASLCPEEYENLADTIVSGESEYIWPQFCRDYLKGEPKKLYVESGTVNLEDSPTPRFDLIKTDRYQRVSLQFSRGCPFQCEFCDIIIMFGRTPRNKRTEQIGRELDALRSRGVTQVFFVDDNFIGNRKLAKELLAYLVDYQKEHQYRFSFGTEASINLADDDTLLHLMKAANFEWVFIGIETPSEESLKETKKVQNLKGSLLGKVQKIYAGGLDIMAGFIVGFDSDDHTIFERQYRFIEDSGIVTAMVGLLIALPKTPLYKRLDEQHRLIHADKIDHTRPFTNILPLQMSSEELVEGYVGLQRRLLRDYTVHRRIANKVAHLNPTAQYSELKLRTKLLYLSRIFFKGVLPGGPKRLYYFMRSMALGVRKPQILNIVIADWVAGISLKSFAARFLERPVSLGEWASRHFERSFRRLYQKVSLKISQIQGGEEILIGLKDYVDRRTIKTLVKSVHQYVRRCQGNIVLDFSEIRESGIPSLQPIFRRLSSYGNQVHLYITQEIYQKFRDELVGFQFTLAAAPA